MSLIQSGYAVSTRRGFLGVLFPALLALALFDTGAATAQEVKQIKLTDKHIQGFIAAYEDIAKLYDGANPEPDPRAEAQAAAVAKKNGFASLDEYDDASMNIAMIMSGIDPQTKKFTEPPEQIKKEIAALKADKSVPEAEVQGKHRAGAKVLRQARAAHAGAGFEPATCGLEICLLALKPDQAARRPRRPPRCHARRVDIPQRAPAVPASAGPHTIPRSSYWIGPENGRRCDCLLRSSCPGNPHLVIARPELALMPLTREVAYRVGRLDTLTNVADASIRNR